MEDYMINGNLGQQKVAWLRLERGNQLRPISNIIRTEAMNFRLFTLLNYN